MIEDIPNLVPRRGTQQRTGREARKRFRVFWTWKESGLARSQAPWRGGSEVRAGKASPVTLRPEEPRSRGTQWGRVLERSSDPCVEGQAEGKETAAWDTGKDSRERGPACLERVTLKRGKGQDEKLG